MKNIMNPQQPGPADASGLKPLDLMAPPGMCPPAPSTDDAPC